MSPDKAQSRRGTLFKFWINLSRTPLALAIAAIATIGGIRGLFDPNSLVLITAIGSLAYVWAVVYGLGGILMLYGMGFYKVKYEAAANVLIASGAGVQAIITLFFLGINPFITLWSSITLFIFSFCCALRAKHILHGQVLIWVESGDSIFESNNRDI